MAAEIVYRALPDLIGEPGLLSRIAGINGAAVLKRKRRQLTLAALICAIAVTVAVSVLALHESRRGVEVGDAFAHDQQVVVAVNGLQAALAEAESSYRGYVMTGDETFLETHTAVLANIRTGLAQISALTAADPRQQPLASELQGAVADRLSVIDTTIRTQRTQEFSAAKAPGVQKAVRLQKARLQLIIDSIALEGQRQLEQRQGELVASRSRVQYSVAALVGVLCAAIALIYVLACRSTAADLRAEALNRTLNIELERRVQDRTNELAQRTAELEERTGQLESFSYSVSHDLRAPLRAVSGFAQILARRHRGSLDEEGRHFLDNIVDASGHMGRLIDDLLSYSRLGRQALVLKPVSLAVVLAEVARSLELRAADSGATLCIADDLPVVCGDRTLLSQIFTNLLDNALTYRKPDVPVKVGVTWTSVGDKVIVTVADNGIGIAPEHFDSIFNVFQRLHTQDAYPGTGIGLAVVKKAVEVQGGKIGVESMPGVGSTFRVELAPSPPVATQVPPG
jgi:signal transduction histidine kinase